jgi:hypothetical protein
VPAVLGGVRSVQMSPLAFLRNPALWLTVLSKFASTLSLFISVFSLSISVLKRHSSCLVSRFLFPPQV